MPYRSFAQNRKKSFANSRLKSPILNQLKVKVIDDRQVVESDHALSSTGSQSYRQTRSLLLAAKGSRPSITSKTNARLFGIGAWHYPRIFMRIAIATACVLFAAPSFSRAEATCFVTVAREIPRMTDISQSVLPSPAQRRQSNSRGETNLLAGDCGRRCPNQCPMAKFAIKASADRSLSFRSSLVPPNDKAADGPSSVRTGTTNPSANPKSAASPPTTRASSGSGQDV